MHSILAKDFQRKKRKTHKPITNKNTHKHRQVTLHTNERGRQDPEYSFIMFIDRGSSLGV